VTSTAIQFTDARRRAELRGRASGVSILAFFALAWTGWGTGGHLPTVAQVVLMVAAAVFSAALAGIAWHRVRAFEASVGGAAEGAGDITDGGDRGGSGGDAAGRRRISRRFAIVVGIEWIGLFILAGALGATGHEVVIPAVVALGVGLHFIPLARLFGVGVYHLTAVLMSLSAVAAMVLAPLVGRPALWTLLPGLGSAVVLYGTCVALLRQVARLTNG